jgi:hypothetical protein
MAVPNYDNLIVSTSRKHVKQDAGQYQPEYPTMVV